VSPATVIVTRSSALTRYWPGPARMPVGFKLLLGRRCGPGPPPAPGLGGPQAVRAIQLEVQVCCRRNALTVTVTRTAWIHYSKLKLAFIMIMIMMLVMSRR
jgi:hypothetical protein